MKLSKLKPNPANPRIIKDEKFDKLVKSIQDFPEMMEKRPMVCVTDKDGKLFPLGGNMRLRAIEKIGMKEIPDSWVTLADDWTEEKRKEFTIKDNVGFGEFDWSELANSWDSEKLAEWGFDAGGFNLSPDGLGEGFTLPDGDKAPFQQMTFTLADAQAERIKAALTEVEIMDGTQYGNENSNGNALHQIVLEWDEQRR